MQSKIVLFTGIILMAGCGSTIARHIGYEGIQQSLFVGFALGVVLLGQAPALALRKRVSELEAKLAAISKTAA